jgi:CBS domain-containing protein
MEGTRARHPRADDVVRRDVPTCRLDERLGDVRTRVRARGWDVCIVVNEAGVVLGRLGGAAWTARRGTSVERVMEIPTTYRPDNLLASLVGVMRKKRATSLLITDSEGVLVGVLARRDGERRLAAPTSARRRRRPKTAGAAR